MTAPDAGRSETPERCSRGGEVMPCRCYTDEAAGRSRTRFRLVCADGSDHLHELHGAPITHEDERHLADVGDYMDQPRPETLWDCGPHSTAPDAGRSQTHWHTFYDFGGEPQVEVCTCHRGTDHDDADTPDDARSQT